MKDACTHVRLEHRRTIECCLNAGESMSETARGTGFNASAIRREILRNRRSDGASYSKNKDENDCAHLKDCAVRSLCGSGCDRRLCRCCSYPCHQLGCPLYEPRTCALPLGAAQRCQKKTSQS